MPIVGEALDVFWAPVQTTFVMAMYCPDASDTEKTGGIGSTALPYVSFVEEILPLTDIVPTATMGWLGEFAWPFLMEQMLVTKESEPAPVASSVPGNSLRDSLLTNQ
uniref:Uncharacterized protein n=1 Tax=Entomoneis paludosa TaxID=265537 RepID=A0A7S2Y7F0_9STRA